MSCAGVVLTGGASRRMGRDKAALPAFADGTLAERTGRLLEAHTSPCIELGPGRSGLASRPDPGGGPLLALAAADPFWATLPGDGHVIVVATDLPRLTGSLLAWLAAHPAPEAVVPVDGERRQVLCARYPVAALRTAPEAVSTGATSMLAWVAGLAVHDAGPDEWSAAAGDPWVLRDADTPEDLAALAAGSGGAW